MVDAAPTSDLDKRLAALNKTHSECLYYAITLTADDNLKMVFTTCTLFVGWADEEKGWELRKGRYVYPEYVTIWQVAGQPYAIIHTVDELTLFMLGGGNALVEKCLAEKVFDHLLGPSPCIPYGFAGFTDPDLLKPEAFRRVPTPKLRMQVLTRDGRRCRICGRRPDDHEDLELHVHHIRPWARGGVTDPINLLTLCSTCHKGLEPHEDHNLFGYTLRTRSDSDDPLVIRFQELLKGIANYRKLNFLESTPVVRQTRRTTRKRSASARTER